MNLTAKDIMNASVITVHEDMTVHELAAFFAENLISGAPVVDQEGKLTGVVSLMDIVRSDAHRVDLVKDGTDGHYYLDGWEDHLDKEEIENFHVVVEDGMTVQEIMTPRIFQVSEDTPIVEMADLMIGGRIHRLIVTKKNHVVGIVTTLDMLKVIRDHARSPNQTA